MPRRPTAERPLPAFPPTEPVSPFSDPVSTISSHGPHHAPSRPSPLNPTLSGDNLRSSKRNRDTNYTIGSNSTQPHSRNSEAGPSSGSGSSEDSERDLHDIQAGHIGANYGPYPVGFLDIFYNVLNPRLTQKTRGGYLFSDIHYIAHLHVFASWLM